MTKNQEFEKTHLHFGQYLLSELPMITKTQTIRLEKDVNRIKKRVQFETFVFCTIHIGL